MRWFQPPLILSLGVFRSPVQPSPIRCGLIKALLFSWCDDPIWLHNLQLRSAEFKICAAKASNEHETAALRHGITTCVTQDYEARLSFLEFSTVSPAGGILGTLQRYRGISLNSLSLVGSSPYALSLPQSLWATSKTEAPVLIFALINMSLDQISFLPPAEQERILNGPALQPPAGIVPNFENPPSGNTLCRAVLTICLIISSLAVVNRAYSRIFCLKRVEIEDCEMIQAF